jgi:hypothetical protein
MRVFVLGAGASLHAGYPLAARMGKSLATWIQTLPSDHRYRDRLNQIVDIYGALDDFESILADLMTCAPGSYAASLDSMRPDLLSELKEAIRDHFDAIRSAPALLYDSLACLIRPSDVVITFNYDLGVERALRVAGLWNIKTGYGFPVEPGDTPSPVEVLKLHGSTNWRALLFGGRTGFFAGGGNSLGNRPVLLFRSDLEYIGCPEFIDPQCSGLDAAASLPAMIMPALPKAFHFSTTYGLEWKSFWDRLWNRAAEAISKADHIAVIGYSLPSVDERARDLLLGTSNKGVRLTICCGDATTRLEQEFRDHNFSGIESVAMTFDGFLASERAKAPIATSAPVGEKNSVLSRLQALTGREGLLKIRFAGEVPFIFVSVYTPADLPAVTDDQEFQTVITRSRFLVRFGDGILLDGSDTRVISGRDISLIKGRY